MEKYIVNLTEEERLSLLSLVKKGKVAAYKLTHGRIILAADESEGKKSSDVEIAEMLHVGAKTVKRIRKRFVEEGLESALCRKPHKRSRQRKLNGDQEAQLVALSCSTPPVGRTSWTLKLLANQMMELEIVDTISSSTVGRTLKKTK